MYASRNAHLKEACVTVRDLWKESVSAAWTPIEARNCSLSNKKKGLDFTDSPFFVGKAPFSNKKWASISPFFVGKAPISNKKWALTSQFFVGSAPVSKKKRA